MHKHVPITKWMAEYNTEKMFADAIAGVTVGLTVIPQALAYATLAGLEPQYGLYSSFAGCFIYTVFGSCRDITIGPTALMALMTYQQIVGRNKDFAFLLCFLTGVVQLLMGILHLGILIDFISIPVTVGFTSATSVIIAASQLKGLLGLKFQSENFVETLKLVVQNIGNTRWPDALLGFTCIFILLAMRKLKDVKMKGPDLLKVKRIEKTLWLLSTSRNALVVLFCTIVAYVMQEHGSGAPFQLTGNVRSGLPEISLPPFHTEIGNKTYTFIEMCSELGSSIVLVPMIGVLGNVALAKAFASGDTIDATQELFTLSLCNVFGAFVSAMPVTGSFSRSAVNHASGVATQFGGVYTGILVLLALSLLTPYFFFMPKAALAAVIICAVIFMIEYEVVKPMWRSRRADLLPAFATFAICLIVGVELGILAGVVVNVAILLYPSARPQITLEKSSTRSGAGYILITLGNSLYFPGVEYIRTYVAKAAQKEGSNSLPIVIDCRFVLGADFTAAKGLCSLGSDLLKRGQHLILLKPRDTVTSVLEGAGAAVKIAASEEELETSIHDLTGYKMSTRSLCISDNKSVISANFEPVLTLHRDKEDNVEIVIASEPYSAMPLLDNRNLPNNDICEKSSNRNKL